MKLLGVQIHKTTVIIHGMLFIALLTFAALSFLSPNSISINIGNNYKLSIGYIGTSFFFTFESLNAAILHVFSEQQKIKPFGFVCSLNDLPRWGYLIIGWGYPILAYIAFIAIYVYRHRKPLPTPD